MHYIYIIQFQDDASLSKLGAIMQWVTQNAVPLIGAAVMIITVIFIAVGRTVTNGHAIVLAAGAILLA